VMIKFTVLAMIIDGGYLSYFPLVLAMLSIVVLLRSRSEVFARRFAHAANSVILLYMGVTLCFLALTFERQAYMATIPNADSGVDAFLGLLNLANIAGKSSLGMGLIMLAQVSRALLNRPDREALDSAEV